ncbi:MAG: lipoprotein N-acyltransferase Lnb domain-containing protein [Candidatus Moraniibacteriota bacterium]
MLISKNKVAVSIIILILISLGAWVLVKKPSHNRNWENGQEKLPKIELSGDKIKVVNYRNFNWQDDGTVENVYQEEYFELSKIQGVDVIISHFSDFEGLAHIFLSFRFADDKNLVVSVETRREKGEEFSPWLGIIRKFEIIYVVGSEKDIIGVRTDIRKERVYIYPTVATPQKARKLFLLLADDINHIYAKPTFYNTLLNNCTNTITRRVEDISEVKFPLTYKTILPGFMDEILYEIKLIPTDKDFLEIKNYYQVDNSRVNRNNLDYSKQIREH